jgi:3-hydroxyacyl-[acyl-carrier-protein] dehydratase
MPPALIFDISGIDLNAVVADQEAIRAINPQRGDMEHLNGVCYYHDSGRIVGYKDVRADEFWVAGHIPGRPLLPGVLMIESAAQLASFYVKGILKTPGFIGFGGVEECKFRQSVQPGCRLYIIALQEVGRHRRFRSLVQGLVNGQVVFEATIVGVVM